MILNHYCIRLAMDDSYPYWDDFRLTRGAYYKSIKFIL